MRKSKLQAANLEGNADDVEVAQPGRHAVREVVVVDPDIVVHEDQHVGLAGLDPRVVELGEPSAVRECHPRYQPAVRRESPE